jgi:hypothetical protein
MTAMHVFLNNSHIFSGRIYLIGLTPELCQSAKKLSQSIALTWYFRERLLVTNVWLAERLKMRTPTSKSLGASMMVERFKNVRMRGTPGVKAPF